MGSSVHCAVPKSSHERMSFLNEIIENMVLFLNFVWCAKIRRCLVCIFPTIANASTWNIYPEESPSITKPHIQLKVPISLLTYLQTYSSHVHELWGADGLWIIKLREDYDSYKRSATWNSSGNVACVIYKPKKNCLVLLLLFRLFSTSHSYLFSQITREKLDSHINF